MRAGLFFFGVFLCSAVSGCMLNQRMRTGQEPFQAEKFTVHSVPKGAQVAFSSGETCVTPCTVTRDANHSFTVRVLKDGYKTKTVAIVSHAEVVPGSGAKTLGRVHLVPNPLTANLEPEWTKR